MDQEPKKIQSIEEYYQLLAEFENLWFGNVDTSPGTPGFVRFEELSNLLDEFEKEMFPITQEPRRSGGRF
jgi:hypothetical protein